MTPRPHEPVLARAGARTVRARRVGPRIPDAWVRPVQLLCGTPEGSLG